MSDDLTPLEERVLVLLARAQEGGNPIPEGKDNAAASIALLLGESRDDVRRAALVMLAFAFKYDPDASDDTVADFCQVSPTEVAAVRTRLVAGKLLTKDGFQARWALDPDKDGGGLEFAMDQNVAAGLFTRSIRASDGEPLYKITPQGEREAKAMLKGLAREQ